MSSCNCSSNVILPTVAEDYAVTTGSVQSCAPCEDGVCSSDSEGSAVPSLWLDSCCKNEGVTLFGRVGNRLSHFTGSGFIKLVKGKASVVSAVPLALTTLWHNFFKTGPGNRPVVGDPLPFSYLAVGAPDGALHAIKGTDEVSSPIWDGTQWTIAPLSEQGLCQKGLLPRLEELELVGYAPIVEGGDVDAVRCLSSLQGSGIIVVNAVATVDSECACEGCEPSPAFASVASFLAFPDDDVNSYSLKWSNADGPTWVQDS